MSFFCLDNNKKLNCLDLEERILYLIYKNSGNISKDDIYKFSSLNDKNEIDDILKYLEMSKYVFKDENDIFSLSDYNTHTFIKILEYLSSLNKPVSRSEIKENIRCKEIHLILNRMIRSKILSILRLINRHVDFIFISNKKDEMDLVINNMFCEQIKKNIKKKYEIKLSSKEIDVIIDIILVLWKEEENNVNDYKFKNLKYLNEDEKKIFNFIKKNKKIDPISVINYCIPENLDLGKNIIINLIKKHYLLGSIINGKIWIK